jgi:hypothetical protein
MEEGRGSDGEKIDLKTGNKAKGNSNRTPSQIEAFERARESIVQKPSLLCVLCSKVRVLCGKFSVLCCKRKHMQVHSIVQKPSLLCLYTRIYT